MKIGDYLDQVASAYVPGVAAYYQPLNPNPWNRAHDDFQESLKSPDFDHRLDAAKAFASRCLELIERFKRDSQPSKGVSVIDAVHMMSEERVMAHQSVKYKECYKCRTKEGLGLESYGEEALQVRVVCKACKVKLPSR